MTARDVDLLQKYLGEKIDALDSALRRMRQEASDDHALVRADLRNLTDRVVALEHDDAVEEGRRQFRADLVRRVITANAAIAVVIGVVFAVVDHL